MGTILASAIIGKARIVLQDAAKVRWSDDELLSWLNAGQREVVLLKPDAYVVTAAVQMVAGTKQTVPFGFLIDVVRNMGAAGTTPGKAIRPITREILDDQDPDWHSSTADAVALYSVFDIRNPSVFYLYPPQPATPGYVEIAYPGTPADVLLAGAITLADIYENVLMDYVLFRAFSKEAEYANSGVAAQYYASVVRALGGKVMAEKQNKRKDAADAS